MARNRPLLFTFLESNWTHGFTCFISAQQLVATGMQPKLHRYATRWWCLTKVVYSSVRKYTFDIWCLAFLISFSTIIAQMPFISNGYLQLIVNVMLWNTGGKRARPALCGSCLFTTSEISIKCACIFTRLQSSSVYFDAINGIYSTNKTRINLKLLAQFGYFTISTEWGISNNGMSWYFSKAISVFN